MNEYIKVTKTAGFHPTTKDGGLSRPKICNWWLVKASRSIRFSDYGNTINICIPVRFVGRRVRLKLEEVEV